MSETGGAGFWACREADARVACQCKQTSDSEAELDAVVTDTAEEGIRVPDQGSNVSTGGEELIYDEKEHQDTA